MAQNLVGADRDARNKYGQHDCDDSSQDYLLDVLIVDAVACPSRILWQGGKLFLQSAFRRDVPETIVLRNMATGFVVSAHNDAACRGSSRWWQ